MKTRHILTGCLACLLMVAGLAAGGCRREESGAPGGKSTTQAAPTPGATGAARTEFTLPDVDVGKLPSTLQIKIGAARGARGVGGDAAKVGGLGALYYVHGFPGAAASCFTRAAELAPQEPAWQCYLGLAQEGAGNGAAAAAAYEKALAVDGKCQLARVRSALLLMDKDPERASKLLRQALEADPGDLAAEFGLARCASAAGRNEEAVAGLRRVLAAAPECAPAHQALAALLKAQGKAEEAARHERQAAESVGDLSLAGPLEISLRRQGLDVDVLLSDARGLAAEGQAAQAEENLKTALGIAPDDLRVRVGLGLLRAMQGRLDDAVAELRRAVESKPDYAVAKSALGEALAESGKADEAERLFREVLERDPDHEETVQRFIALMTVGGKLEEALRFFESAAAAHPAEPALEYGLAEVLIAAKREPEAVVHLRKVIELSPEHVDARHALAVALYTQGDRAGARAEWEQALRSNPRFVTAYVALCGVALDEKNTPAAADILRKGLAQAPDAPVLANALAWILATAADPQQRNGGQAVELAQKACGATLGTNHGYLDTLAVALAEAGRFDDAVRTAQRAIAVADKAGAKGAVEAYRGRLALYEQKKPYHEAE
jgi:tetratricopeptide (TPR) repeat protein